MRLLFIYFYETKGAFKEGTIISFSKKYKVKKIDNLENYTSIDFTFHLELNDSYQDNFYGDNVDISVIIGENGTGKSFLLNSLRKNNNIPSVAIYEKGNEWFAKNNGYHKIHILYKKTLHYIDFFNDISTIYYTPIFDKNVITDNKDKNSFYYNEYNVSDIQILNQFSNLNFFESLAKIENDDINDYLELNTKLVNNYVEIKKIKIELSDKILKGMYEWKYFKLDLFNHIVYIVQNDNLLLNNFMFKVVNQLSENEKNELCNENKNLENLEYIFYFDKKILTKCQRIIHKNLSKKYILVDDRIVELNEINYFDDGFLKKIINKNTNPLEIIFDLKKILKNVLDKQNNYLFDIKSIAELEKKLFTLVNKRVTVVKHLYKISKILYILDKYNINITIKNLLPLEIKQKNLILKYQYSSLNQYIQYLVKDYNRTSTYNRCFSLIRDYIIYRQDIGKRILELGNKLNFELKKELFIFALSNVFRNVSDKEKLLLFLFFQMITKEEYPLQFYNFEVINLETVEHLILRLEKEFKIKKENFFTREVALILKYMDSDLSIDVDMLKSIDWNLRNSFLLREDLYTYKFSPPLSAGQQTILFIFARINRAINEIEKHYQKFNEKYDSIQKSDTYILILLDEADLKLHLEWQRIFIKQLINFFQGINKDKHDNTIKYNILYATHSPMILSDITDDRIVFLEKKKDNEGIEYSIDKPLKKGKATFGANIYDLYHDSFFMDKYMGEFAFNKINDVINMVNLYKIVIKLKDDKEKEKLNDYERIYNLDELYKSYALYYPNEKIESKNLYENREDIKANIENKKEVLIAITKFIGEPLLRNKLEDDLNSMGREKVDIDKVVESLKKLSQKEIKDELAKYSESIQMKILKKLFASEDKS